MHIRCQDLAASLQTVGRTNIFKRHRLNDNINEFMTLALRKGRLIFTFSNLAVTFSRRRKKQSCKSRPVLHTVTGSFWRQWATRLFNQSPVLLWSAKVAANILWRDWALLALAHPALVLFLLWEAVPKDLEGLPYGFLAHFSHQKKQTPFTLEHQLVVLAVISTVFWSGRHFNAWRSLLGNKHHVVGSLPGHNKHL